jgi:hypothetical protein
VVRKSRQQAVRALLWEWDPLGDDDPANPYLPRDEYDWLVDGVGRELDEGADAARVAGYLTNSVRTRYGLDDPPPDEVVQRIAVVSARGVLALGVWRERAATAQRAA